MINDKYLNGSFLGHELQAELMFKRREYWDCKFFRRSRCRARMGRPVNANVAQNKVVVAAESSAIDHRHAVC